jgi:hypothetical protein
MATKTKTKTKAIDRKSRFAASAKDTKKITRETRFTRPTDADADDDSPEITRTTRHQKTQKHTDAKNWANNHNGASDKDDQDESEDSCRERQRLDMIRIRNRRRLYPWLPALGVLPLGWLAQLIGWLLPLVTGVPAFQAVLGVAAVPMVTAIAVAVRYRQTHRHWLPDLAAAGVGSAGITCWIGMTGVSWLTILAVLLGTLAGGTRWWKAHPMGPGVPRLEPPRPETPKAVPGPPTETDPYCVAWNTYNARDGKAKDSRLSNRRETEFTISYDVELKRGIQAMRDLQANRESLASGLGIDTDRLIFKRPPRGSGAHKAIMTIIIKDPVSEVRYYRGPKVENGVIKDLNRFVDGSTINGSTGVDIVMWNKGGTRPTMIVGSTGGGKSGAANAVTCGAMSTGVMNLLYADPKGNSSTALASRARVAIIGKENVLKLPWLVTQMLRARERIASQLGADQIFPTKELPGWMFLHDEYSVVANDPLAQRVLTEAVNIVRSLGFWPVFLNQSQGQPQWGSDHCRAALAGQIVAFRTNSKSGSDLVPGLAFDPNELPVDEMGMPVPGMAVHGYQDVPTRWDFLPSDADAQHMREKGEPAPPYTTSTAFDAFFQQPEVYLDDRLAIEAVLGPAINGRWQVGGKGATHQFPESLEALQQKIAPRAGKKTAGGGWGQRAAAAAKAPAEAQLTPAQAEVLEVVRSGTANTGDIIDRAKAARSTVMESLNVLANLNLIRKTERGLYEVKTEA